MALQFAFVIHRGMRCDDESATDEEQAEKIMFYHPRQTPVSDQLNKINMIEGLIDFAAKFSVDPVSTVVMQKYTWAFFECEPDVWFIIAADSQVAESTTDSGLVHPPHQPNTHAMEASLRSMYEIYCTTNGSIRKALAGDIGSTNVADELIRRVKSIRKQIRKIRIRQRQEQRDLQSLLNREEDARRAAEARANGEEGWEEDNSDVEHMGLRSDAKTIAEVQAEIEASEKEIAALTVQVNEALLDPSYTPHRVRANLESFLQWYLSVGQLEVQTALAGMSGVRLLQPNYPDPVLNTIHACGGLTAAGAGTSTGAGGVSSVSGGANGLGSGTLSSMAGLGISTAAATSIQQSSNSTYGGVVSVSASAVGSLQSGLQATAGSGALSTAVLRIRHAVEQATLQQSIGCVVLYDGRVAWSDLSAPTTQALAQYVVHQDMHAVRTMALQVVHTLDIRPLPSGGAGGSSTSSSAVSSRDSVKKATSQEAELETAVQRSFNKLLTLRGFVSRGWEVSNLEETRLAPLLSVATSGSVGGQSGKAQSEGGSATTSEKASAGMGGLAINTGTGTGAGSGGGSGREGASTKGVGGAVGSGVNEDVTAAHCEGSSKIYCPRIFSPQSAAAGQAIGRAIFYKQGRATVVVVLPNWDSNTHSVLTATSTSNSTAAAPGSLGDKPGIACTDSLDDLPTVPVSGTDKAVPPPAPRAEDSAGYAASEQRQGLQFKAAAVARLLAELRHNPRKHANLRGQDYLSYLQRLEPAAAAAAGEGNGSAVDGVNQSELSLSTLGSGRTADSGPVEGRADVPALDPVQLARQLNHACLLALCCALQAELNPECVRLEKALKNAIYADETGALLRNASLSGATGIGSGAGSGSASAEYTASVGSGVVGGGAGVGQVAGASGSSNSASANASLERLASGIAIAEELRLGAVRQEIPIPTALRNVRFIYYNPVDASIKVCGLNSADLSPLLCSPRVFRELVVSNLLQSGQKTPTAGVGSAFTPSISSRASAPFSNSASGAGGVGSSSTRVRRVTAAVVDRLTDRQGFKCPTSSALLAECLEPQVIRALNDIWIELSGRELAPATAGVARPVHEACLRVSTPQRGGVWVTGRRLGERYLYMVIDRCVTMNDMYAAFELLADVLQK